MKTERRHELQTNVLASSLSQWLKAAQPYSRAGLAVVIALVVALFAWAYLSAQSTRRVADGWNEYFEAIGGNNPDPRETLRDISSRYSDTMVGQWSRLTLANMELDDGTNRLLQDRKAARDELRDAEEKFKALLLEASHDTILQRATYGLAQAHEGMGELEDARTQYRALVKKWPASPFAPPAKSRADELDQLATKNFYDWLAKYEPTSFSKEPGTPGTKPDFLKEPDASGMLKLPSSATPELPSLTDQPAGTPPTADGPPDAAAPEKPSETPADPPTEPAPSEAPPQESAPPETPPGESGPKPE